MSSAAQNNLTDRLGELIGCAESGAASDRSQLAHFVLNHKDEILSALRKAEEADTAIERLTAREAELREALRPFARQKTIEEIMAGEEPAPEWVGATPERRIELMGERKRENTANILRARLSLGDEK